MRNRRINRHGSAGVCRGGRAQCHVGLTVCPNLVIIACAELDSGGGGRSGGGEFCLVHIPSGFRLPVSGTAGAMGELARRLLWFGEILEPALLASPVNPAVCERLRGLLTTLLDEPDGPEFPARSGSDSSMHSRALGDVAS